MKRPGPWLVLAALLVMAVVLIVLIGPQSAQDSPNHSSESDGKNGTSALRYYAGALGHSSSALEGSFNLPSGPGLVFIFTPAPFRQDETNRLNQWISNGGVAVFASEEPDAQLAVQFGISRPRTTVPAQANANAPILAGVNSVLGNNAVR